MSIDLGLPIVSVGQMMENVQQQAGKNELFNHKFFLRVKDILDAEDTDAVLKEQIPIKLLQLDPVCQNGFLLSDFPRNVHESMMLETFRGGLNSFVYLNLPEEVREQIANVKVQCTHCNRLYYNADVVN